MSKFQNYLKTFDITSTLTEEDIDKTLALLQIYGPAVRRTASRIGEMEEECYARVSTAEQNEDRQVLELLKYGIELMVLSTECNFLPNGVFER